MQQLLEWQQLSEQVLEQILSTATTDEVALVSRSQMRSQDESIATINQRDAEQLLAHVDQLSDEEVNTLLSEMMQEEHSHTSNGHKVGADSGYREGATNGISPQEAARLLAQLDQLSDEHVDSLLSQIVQEEE